MTSFIKNPIAIAIAAALSALSMPTEAADASGVLTEGKIVIPSDQKKHALLLNFEGADTSCDNKVTFVKSQDFNSNSASSHGINVAASGDDYRDLTLQFGTDTQHVDINVTVGEQGDTGILVNSYANQTNFKGGINFVVNKGSTLNVTNKSLGTTGSVSRPTSDGIELRVQDGSSHPNNINVAFDGAGTIKTAGGAGLYLLQSGKGDITVNLSRDVKIETHGDETTNAEYHMANHGINAVMQETHAYAQDQLAIQKDPTRQPTVSNANRGTIAIHSGANIEIHGKKAAGIYARNLSGNVVITTEATSTVVNASGQTVTQSEIAATGYQSKGIYVRGSEGHTAIHNKANLVLNRPTTDHGTKAESKAEATGIEVYVGKLNASHSNEKYDMGKVDGEAVNPYGNGTGYVDIINEGLIDAYGEKSTGIRVQREATVATPVDPQHDIAIRVQNVGDINLHNAKTVGIDIKNSSLTADKVYVTNQGKLTLDGANSTGIRIENTTTQAAPVVPSAVGSTLPQFSSETTVGVINTGDIINQTGNDSTGIDITNKSVTPNRVTVYNEGWLNIAGNNSTGIRINHTTTGPTAGTLADARLSTQTPPEKPESLPPLTGNKTLGVWNVGNITLEGSHAKGIDIKNVSAEKEDVVVANAGHLIMNGAATTGISVENQRGDILVTSQGSITITKPTANQPLSNSVGEPYAKLTEGKTFGIKAVAKNGNVVILSEKPNLPREFSLEVTGADAVRGIMGLVQGGNGRVQIHNDKNVQITNGKSNVGVAAVRQQVEGSTLGKGWIEVVNRGNVTVTGSSGKSGGIVAQNDNGCSTVWALGGIKLDKASEAVGLAAVSQNGNSLVLAEPDRVYGHNEVAPRIDISGTKLVGIFAYANGQVNHPIDQTVHGGGQGGSAGPLMGASAGVLNIKDIHVEGEGNKGIAVQSDAEGGIAGIRNYGQITMIDKEGHDGSVGLSAFATKGDAVIEHNGGIYAQNLKYGIHAVAGNTASVTVVGDILVEDTDRNLSDSFAMKVEGEQGNKVIAHKNIIGTQAIKVVSGSQAKNEIQLHGIVKANNGYAIVLDTKSDANLAQPSQEAFTQIVNNVGGTLYGQISGKSTTGEITQAYNNQLRTEVLNQGHWIVGHEGSAQDTYDTTILGTSGKNSIMNTGVMMMDKRLTKAVTWNQMGVKTFTNQGILDLSSNQKAGDWLTITNQTDISTNFDRQQLVEGTADFYKIKDRTHDAKYDGEFVSNGGNFLLDVNLGDDNTGFADVLIVDNVRLEGAPTILSFTNRRDKVPLDETPLNKGIEVVHVRGTERNDAGAFVLGTTLTLNGYQYILEQDSEDKNWYIRNYLQDAGGPSAPLIDPNAGAYLAGAWLNARVFNHNLYDRRDSSWNKDKTVWARIEHNDGEGRFFNDAQRSNLWSNVVQVGTELYQKDDRMAGVFAAYGRTKADNFAPQTNTSGRVESTGYQLGAYWTYLPNYGDGAYVDLWAYYAWFNNKLSGQAVNDRIVKFDSEGFALSAETGYSWQPNNGRFTIEPHVQVIYNRFDADDANVEGTIYRGKTRGFQTRVGARFFNDSMVTPEGTKLTPILEANWLYNGANDKVRAGTTTLESELGRHVGELKLGWQGSMGEGWQTWGHVGMQRGADHYRNLELQFGLGFKF